MNHFNRIPLGQQDGPFNAVFQFPYISGPLMRQKRFNDGSGNPLDRLALLFCIFDDKMIGQQDDVVTAVLQGRQVQRKNAEPVIKVRAELAGGNAILQTPVRGGDHACVGRDHARRTERLDLLFLQDPQQLGLCRRRQFRHLIQKDRPVMGFLETSAPLPHGAREGSLLVSEKLAFDQGVGDRGAVHLDQRTLTAGTVRVNGAGDELLARPRVTQNQDGRAGIRHMADQAENLLHPLGMPDDIDGRRLPLIDNSAETPVLLLQGEDMNRLGDEFRHGGQHGKLPVQICYIFGPLVGGQDSDNPGIVHDRNAEKG